MRRVFRPADVCRLVRITPSQLEYFVVHGVIEPLEHAPKPGSYRLYSVRNVYEAALAAELAAAGVTGHRLQAAFAALRTSLASVPRRLRAAAIFLRYTEAVKAIATILGQTDDPQHRTWLREVDAIIQSWHHQRTPLDERILAVLAARPTLGRTARSETTR